MAKNENRVEVYDSVSGKKGLALTYFIPGMACPYTTYFSEGFPEITGSSTWKEILKAPVSNVSYYEGKEEKAILSYSGGKYAMVEIYKSSRNNRGFQREPFAVFPARLAPLKKEWASGKVVYSVSVATYDGDNDSLTSYSGAFSTPEGAADWFEEDWNEQAEEYGGEPLDKEAKASFIRGLKSKSGIADVENPGDWGTWMVWKGVRTELK